MLAQGTPRCPHCRHDGDWWDTTTATPTPDPAGVNRNA